MSLFKNDQGGGIDLGKNETASLFQTFIRCFLWLFASTAVCIVLFVGFIPGILGFMKKTDEYVKFLENVTAYEYTIARSYARSTNMNSSHVFYADSIVSKVLGERKERDSLVMESQTKINTGNDQDQKVSSDSVAKMDQLLRNLTQDRFFVCLREWATIWVSRLLILGISIFLFFPLMIAAFFIGEAACRTKMQDGIMPLPERAQWAGQALVWCMPIVVTIPAIPVPFNSAIVIPLSVMGCGWIVYIFRSNFVEF